VPGNTDYNHRNLNPPVVAPVPTRPLSSCPHPLPWLHIDPECHGGTPQPPEKSQRAVPIPKRISMSNLSVVGFVKGDCRWFSIMKSENRMFLLSISAKAWRHSLRTGGNSAGRRQQILRIPAALGIKPIAGHFAVQALTNKPGEATPVFLRFLGWRR